MSDYVRVALTVRPFFRVVDWILDGVEVGVARPLANGLEIPARPRRPFARFRASLREAIGDGGRDGNERF